MTILRIPGIFGSSPGDKSVICRMIESIRRDGQVVISGSGKVLRDYVYIDDLSRLLLHLVPIRYRGTLNIATGKSQSVIDIVSSLCDILQTKFEIVHQAVDQTREFDLVFDNSMLASVAPNFQFSDMAVGIRTYLGSAEENAVSA